MSETARTYAREIAQAHWATGEPLGWFEYLYSSVQGDASLIPWADLSPNPHLVGWLEEQGVEELGNKTLIVGCGLGDDAETLARRGFDTTGFDISQTAIAWCQRRFPRSAVHYVVMDLFQAPGDWEKGFDLVVEAYTLQVLPPAWRKRAMEKISGLVAPGGTLLVLSRGREPIEPEGEIPWPLA